MGFTAAIEESIASLLNVVSQLVDAVVQNFQNSRRLYMTAQEQRLTLTRRLETTDLLVTYVVQTTGDQTDNITNGIVNTVQHELIGVLSEKLAANPAFANANITVFNITDFAPPTVTAMNPTDDTDSDDGISTTTIIIICLCVGIPSLLVVCSFLVLRRWPHRELKTVEPESDVVDQPSQESKVEESGDVAMVVTPVPAPAPRESTKEIREQTVEEVVPSIEIDLSGSNAPFSLVTTIQTFVSGDDNEGVNGFLFGKLPESACGGDGLPLGSKVLTLDDGCLSWEVSGVGQLPGSKRIDDADIHEIAVKFPCGPTNDEYALFVDGELDVCGLVANEDPDDAYFISGPRGAKAYEAFYPDMPRLEGVLGDIEWNGARVVQSEPEVRKDIFPAYKTGEAVEFFSDKNLQWMLATIQVSYKGGFANYSVHFAERLHPRKNVALNNLRRPLAKDEICSYYSREKGRWVPAVILVAPLLKSSYRGYTVRMLDEQTPIRAMAHLLRRQYIRDEHLEVYEGENVGWKEAVAAGEVGCEDEVDVAGILEVGRGDEAHVVGISEVSERAEDNAAIKSGSVDRTYRNIRISYDDGSEKIYPPYLLRRCATPHRAPPSL